MVGSKWCLQPGCPIYASFGYADKSNGKGKGRGKRVHCKAHKKPGMEDLINRICLDDGCTTTASRKFPGQTVTYCAKHALPGMKTYRQLVNCKAPVPTGETRKKHKPGPATSSAPPTTTRKSPGTAAATSPRIGNSVGGDSSDSCATGHAVSGFYLSRILKHIQ